MADHRADCPEFDEGWRWPSLADAVLGYQKCWTCEAVNKLDDKERTTVLDAFQMSLDRRIQAASFTSMGLS